MASTRNKNSPGNYNLETNANRQQFQYETFINGSQGQGSTRHFAGDGLLQGRLRGRDLADNDTDIESYLFGIGSTNLVHALPPVVPRPISMSSLSTIRRLPVVVPNPLEIDKGQRPMFLN